MGQYFNAEDAEFFRRGRGEKITFNSKCFCLILFAAFALYFATFAFKIRLATYLS